VEVAWAVRSVALFSACHPLLLRQAGAPGDLALTATLLVLFALAFVAIRDGLSATLARSLLGVSILARSMLPPI